MRSKDYILLTVLAVSIGLGVFWPAVGRPFSPYVSFFVMGLLFLSFLAIEIGDVWTVTAGRTRMLAWLCLLKLAVLPLIAFGVFRAVAPDFALSALLLGGISTGVVAPFISGLVGANSALVLALVVITSVVGPFTLPAWVRLLSGQEFDVPLGPMIRMLALVIFVPMMVGEILKRTARPAARWIMARSFPASLVFFFVINLGVFSQYSHYFHQRPQVLLQSIPVALVLGVGFAAAGLWAAGSGAPTADRLAASIGMINVNNVLIVVFASEFFTPREPTVAAMYMLPFFAVIVPLRVLGRRMRRREVSP
jgi:BASS family bile acid:Na+ symporter